MGDEAEMLDEFKQKLSELEAKMSRLEGEKDGYEVVRPGRYYKGFSYDRAIADWTNWLCSMDPESHNVPPVQFLTSFSYEKKGTYSMRGPSVSVGDKRVILREGEAVFFPIIMAFVEPDDHPGMPNNAQSMYEYVERDLATSSHSLGAWINGEPIIEEKYFNRHKIGSFFTLQVPSAPPERTFHNAFDIPLVTPGPRNCVALGYWLFIVFNRSSKEPYTLQSYGRAGLSGAYESEIFCQIEVLPKVRQELIPKSESYSSSSNRISRILDDMVTRKELDQGLADEFKKRLVRV
jgi:hypothetical protein